MERQAAGKDLLERALRTQKVGRRMIAIAIIVFICVMPPVFEMIDRAMPGYAVVWIFVVWTVAIACIAAVVERRFDPSLLGSGSPGNRPR